MQIKGKLGKIYIIVGCNADTLIQDNTVDWLSWNADKLNVMVFFVFVIKSNFPTVISTLKYS